MTTKVASDQKGQLPPIQARFTSTASTSTPRSSSSPLASVLAAGPAGGSSASQPTTTTLKQSKKPGPHKTQLRQDRSSRIRHRASASPDGQAIAFSTAESYHIDALRSSLYENGLLGRGKGEDAVNLMGEAIWVPVWPLPRDEGPREGQRPATSTSERAAAGEIFIFESGAFVSWHMSEADARSFAEQVLGSATTSIAGSALGSVVKPSSSTNAAAVEIDRYGERQQEAMDFVVSSGETTGVKGDLIIIGSSDARQRAPDERFEPEGGDSSGHSASAAAAAAAPAPLATAIHPPSSNIAGAGKRSRYARAERVDEHGSSATSGQASLDKAMSRRTVLPRSEDDLKARLSLSRGLARSTKLAVYEEMLDAHMDSVEHIPSILASGSEGALKKKDIIRNTGNLLRIRQYLYLNDENLIDMPEMFWSSPELEIWFKQMTTALDVELRMRNLRTKLDYSLELQDTLLDLNSTKVSHRLEWIIIVLIAIEIALALIREGIPGLSSGRNKHEKEQVRLLE